MNQSEFSELITKKSGIFLHTLPQINTSEFERLSSIQMAMSSTSSTKKTGNMLF